MTRKRWLVGGGLASLALASTLTVGTVFAQSGTTDPQASTQTFIERLAQNLGLSSDQVKQGLQKTQEQYVDDAVSSGKLTADQGAAKKQQIESGQAPLGFGRGFMGGRHGGPGFHDDGIATALGMTEQELRTELQSGKTISQIITDQNKTVADVVSAVVAQEKTELDQAVAAGKLTQDQENQRLDAMTQQLTDAINNNTFDAGRPGGHGPGPMDGRQQQTPQAPAQTS